MLVNCPKCNFSQPKDTYCANCGIEMDAYRPEKKPIFKVLLKNPLTHLVLFLAASYFAYTTYTHKNNSISDLNSQNIGANQVNRKTTVNQKSEMNINAHSPSSNTTAASTNLVPPRGQAQSPIPINHQAATNPLIKAENGRTPSNSEVEKSDSSSGSTTGPWTLNVKYIEISSPGYQQWVNEAQGLEAYAEMGEFVMGKITRGQKNLGRSIDNSTKQFADLKTIRVIAGNLNPDSGNELNINFKYSLMQDASGAFQGEFEINEDDSTGANKKQFNSNFEMKPTEILFIRSVATQNSGKTDTSESEYLILFDFQSRH